MSKKPSWIPEKEAAAMMGYKPIVLRMYVKAGKLAISYFTLHGKCYQYDKNDIEKIIEQNAVIIS